MSAFARSLLPLTLSALLWGASRVETPRHETTHAAERVALARSVALVGFTVSDLDRSIDFYTRVLDFELISRAEVTGHEFAHLSGVFGARAEVARLRVGTEEIELTHFLAPEGRPITADARSNDLSFQHAAIVVRDMDAAYARLREHRVRHASSGPQRLPDWNPNAAGIEAFYFKDPDGHVLEIIDFPAGKGDPRWQQPSERMFLGIDHTAIVVADTERSLAFYRDVLGLRVAGESENFGVEQEHLNNVFGARLRITTLRAEHGPGVELLEYLSPTGGRDYPRDERASDLVHWHTRVLADDLRTAETRTRESRAPWISPGAVELTDSPLGLARALRLRDPDGHVVELAQPATH